MVENTLKEKNSLLQACANDRIVMKFQSQVFFDRWLKGKMTVDMRLV